MEQIRRRRLDASAWSAVLERFAQSGLSVAEFCEREGLGAASFYRWRSVLSSSAAGRKTRRPRPEVKKERAGEFLDLGTVRTSAVDASRMEVRLDLGGGLVLQVLRR